MSDEATSGLSDWQRYLRYRKVQATQKLPALAFWAWLNYEGDIHGNLD